MTDGPARLLLLGVEEKETKQEFAAQPGLGSGTLRTTLTSTSTGRFSTIRPGAPTLPARGR